MDLVCDALYAYDKVRDLPRVGETLDGRVGFYAQLLQGFIIEPPGGW